MSICLSLYYISSFCLFFVCLVRYILFSLFVAFLYISCLSFSLTFLCLSLWASLNILLSLSISLSLYSPLPSLYPSLFPSSLALTIALSISSFSFQFILFLYPSQSPLFLFYSITLSLHLIFFELLNYTFFFPACSSDFFSFPKKAFYIILLPVFPTFFVGLISYQSTVHILYLVCLSCVSVYHSHSHSFFPLSFIFRETFSSSKVPVCSFSLRHYNGFLLAFFSVCLSERRICKHTQWLLLLLGILVYMYCCSNIMKF